MDDTAPAAVGPSVFGGYYDSGDRIVPGDQLQCKEWSESLPVGSRVCGEKTEATTVHSPGETCQGEEGPAGLRGGAAGFGGRFFQVQRHGHVKSRKLNAKGRQRCRGWVLGQREWRRLWEYRKNSGESLEGETSKHDSVRRYQCAAVHDGKVLTEERQFRLPGLPLTHL